MQKENRNMYYYKIAGVTLASCYILPSSVHDLVVLSKESFSEASKLINLVKETNSEHVRLSDRLSDSIYLYSIVDGSINRISEPEEEAS